jgi:hypothetical protein
MHEETIKENLAAVTKRADLGYAAAADLRAARQLDRASALVSAVRHDPDRCSACTDLYRTALDCLADALNCLADARSFLAHTLDASLPDATR